MWQRLRLIWQRFEYTFSSTLLAIFVVYTVGGACHTLSQEMNKDAARARIVTTAGMAERWYSCGIGGRAYPCVLTPSGTLMSVEP